jgi:hypothetical protein
VLPAVMNFGQLVGITGSVGDIMGVDVYRVIHRFAIVTHRTCTEIVDKVALWTYRLWITTG